MPSDLLFIGAVPGKSCHKAMLSDGRRTTWRHLQSIGTVSDVASARAGSQPQRTDTLLSKSITHSLPHTHTVQHYARRCARPAQSFTVKPSPTHTHLVNRVHHSPPHTTQQRARRLRTTFCVHCRTTTHCPRPATRATSLPLVAWRPRDLGSLSSAVPTCRQHRFAKKKSARSLQTALQTTPRFVCCGRFFASCASCSTVELAA